MKNSPEEPSINNAKRILQRDMRFANFKRPLEIKGGRVIKMLVAKLFGIDARISQSVYSKD